MGIETEADYLYTSGGGSTGSCHFSASKIAVSINGYKSVSRGESALKNAMNEGPASLCLAASSWQSYRGGILSRCDNQVDHCVQGVGYSGSSYWRIINSWAQAGENLDLSDLLKVPICARFLMILHILLINTKYDIMKRLCLTLVSMCCK